MCQLLTEGCLDFPKRCITSNCHKDFMQCGVLVAMRDRSEFPLTRRTCVFLER